MEKQILASIQIKMGTLSSIIIELIIVIEI